MKMNSGLEIPVYSVTKMHYLRGDDGPALVVKYGTDLPLTDSEALRREVAQLWEWFRPQVEEAGLEFGIITASEKRVAVGSYETYTFVFQRGADGLWHEPRGNLEKERDAAAEQIVRSLLAGDHRAATESLAYPPEYSAARRELESGNLEAALKIVESRLGRFTAIERLGVEEKSPKKEITFGFGPGDTEYIQANPSYPGRTYRAVTSGGHVFVLELRFTPRNREPATIGFNFPGSDQSSKALAESLLKQVSETWTGRKFTSEDQEKVDRVLNESSKQPPN